MVIARLFCFRCNKLSSCHIPVNSNILPAVCPDTPKYLEAQYQCKSHRKMEEEVRKTKLPDLGGNISDVWSDRNMLLDSRAVEDVIKTVIKNKYIPITDNPDLKENIGNDIKNYSVTQSLNSPKQEEDISKILFEKEDKAVTSLPISVSTYSLYKTEQESDSTWYMTSKEVLILIVISSISVTLVILSAAVIITKTRPACLATKAGLSNIEMSGTGSSADITRLMVGW